MENGSTIAAAALAALVASGCGAAEGDDGAPGAVADTPVVSAPAAPRPPSGHAWVIFGADTVLAEVAATADERAEGLMYREEIPDGTGMLFVFEGVEIRSFWMQNTYVPLDIAYLDPGFVVVDVQRMEPLTSDPHESAAPAQFALEVRQGWFAEHGVRAGSQANIVFGAGAG